MRATVEETTLLNDGSGGMAVLSPELEALLVKLAEEEWELLGRSYGGNHGWRWCVRVRARSAGLGSYGGIDGHEFAGEDMELR